MRNVLFAICAPFLPFVCLFVCCQNKELINLWQILLVFCPSKVCVCVCVSRISTHVLWTSCGKRERGTRECVIWNGPPSLLFVHSKPSYTSNNPTLVGNRSSAWRMCCKGDFLRMVQKRRKNVFLSFQRPHTHSSLLRSQYLYLWHWLTSFSVQNNRQQQ